MRPAGDAAGLDRVRADPHLEPVFGKPGVVVGASTRRLARADARARRRHRLLRPESARTASARRRSRPTRRRWPTARRGSTTSRRSRPAARRRSIVFNELAGPGLVTPWSDTNAQYRANVLSLIQHIAALGAHPVLLIPATIYTGGDALAWWQQVVGRRRDRARDLRAGDRDVEAGRRCSATARCATRYRDAVDGPHVDRHPGEQGRADGQLRDDEGLRRPQRARSPSARGSRWRSGRRSRSKQVAAETGIASVWSWGWGRWSAGEQDPEKGARRVRLAVGASTSRSATRRSSSARSFDTSLQDGQLSLLPAGGAVPDRQAADHERGDPAAAGADRRSRHRVQRALRAVRRVEPVRRSRRSACSRRSRR